MLAPLLASMMIAGCTYRERAQSPKPQPTDTTYTQRAAMMVYDYDPARALQIVDSALIVGNLSEWRADENRMRILSMTRAGKHLDSLKHWAPGARLDSVRAIGGRLLRHDSIRSSLASQQDVLEMLVYTARQQQDTAAYLRYSCQMVDVCRRQGAETEALRTEAEIGASLCLSGHEAEGLAKLDSAISSLELYTLNSQFKFNELDAYIIAAKRKISVLAALGREEETLPLARRILTLLDDYEAHPDRYHDGTYREPPAEKRDDYIRFYRSQAQNFIAAAYAALGRAHNMNATFERLENIVREAETREHLSRYDALRQQMEAQRQRADAERNALIAWGTAVVAVLALCFALYYWRQKRIMAGKNRALVRQIDEALKYKELYQELKLQTPTLDGRGAPAAPTAEAAAALTNEQLFERISKVIVSERLFLDPTFNRQKIIDRFQLSKDRTGAAFSQGSSHDSLTDYVQELRLEHAARLLTGRPDLSIIQVATQSGFTTAQYFSRRFRQRFGMSPTAYRESHPSDV